MGRSFQRASALLFLIASSSVLASACVDNESSLFIRGCLVPSSSDCLVEPTSSSAVRFGGVLDASFLQGYSCPLLIGNQLVARGDADRLRTETSRVQITGADVEVLAEDGVSTLATFSVPASGFADPAQRSNPGYGSASVLLVDAQTAAQNIGKTVISRVVLLGRTLGGIDVESGAWEFPITICSGCLCNQTPCVTGATDDPVSPCNVGSDDPVDCRLGFAACPGTP